MLQCQPGQGWGLGWLSSGTPQQSAGARGASQLVNLMDIGLFSATVSWGRIIRAGRAIDLSALGSIECADRGGEEWPRTRTL